MRRRLDLARGLDRRLFLKLAGTAAVAGATAGVPLRAAAAGAGPRHGLSIFGDLGLPPDFKHLRYVRPDAPRGGRMVMSVPNWYFNQDTQSFDTLNSFVIKGSAPPRMELCFDALMNRALDEPDAVYGHVAESVEISDDGTVYTFRIRPGVRFADGAPLTAEDVAFSYNLLKENGHPNLSDGLREMTNAEAIDADVVELSWSGKQSLSAPLDATGYPIFAKTYWDARDFSASTLEPILGSGPYKVGDFDPGRFIDYVRVEDWWAKDNPLSIGLWNFDVIRIEFYKDRQPEFEAFKKGEILYREEFTSKIWATEYNFPAVEAGRVVKHEFPADARPSMQGWLYNLRREKFADPRTREALGLAFDFEWTNKNLFYGAYTRQSSFFQKSDFEASGPPSAAEAALLEPFRGGVPDAVFGDAWSAPVSDGSGRDRAMLRKAADRLAEAGWTRDGEILRNGAGEALTVEFLIEAEVYERVLQPFVKNLRAIGADASIRLVDSTQYQRRLQDFDFDVVGRAFSLSPTPIEDLDGVFHSRLAKVPGSYNIGGIAVPAVDALIARAGQAKHREDLVVTLKALDRVLRALHVWIPNWYSSAKRVGLWDMFGWPEKPAYGFPVESTWWIDADKAKAIGKG